MTSAPPTGADVVKAPGGGRAVTAVHRPLPGQRREPGTLPVLAAARKNQLVSPSLMRMKVDSPRLLARRRQAAAGLPLVDLQGTLPGHGGGQACQPAGREHEVRVFPGFHDGSQNITLRCCCGEAWNLEPRHTTAELNILALQHRRGI